MAGFSSAFLCQNLVFFIHAVSVYLRPLFSFISSYIFRLPGDGGSFLNKNGEKIDLFETETLDSPEHREEDENNAAEFGVFDEGVVEEEEPELCLKFKFPTYDEFRKLHEETETGNVINSEVVPSATVSKCQITSGESCAGAFIDDAETFSVKEGGIDGSLGSEEVLVGRNLEEDFNQTGCVHDKGKEIEVSDDEKIEEKVVECRFDFEQKSVILDSDSESTSFEHMRSVMNRLVDSYSDGFLSDGDFGGGFDVDDDNESESELSGFEENDEFEDEDSDIMEELKQLEENDKNNNNNNNSNNVENVDEHTNDDDKGVDDYEKIRSSMSESEDPKNLESLWEHQELIEQLKMELKKVKATGLPTILEDSESSKISEDLKPWKIDEFQREDCIGELHKFYKSYRERMRKFDIINYQKMYAMGFLQLKDPLQSISKQKRAPTLKSLVSQNLWLSKHKIHGSDPMKKFIKELQGDLEAVYVGQMCLSWEFLHWQYEKAWDLWDSDPRGRRRYNEVAGEFQQFQVLMHRFIEDELFQGPRVQNYVKTRCAVRNLLQVPVIREDNLKDKRKADKRGMDEYVITSDLLVEIVEESIRTFWRFVRADKDCSSASINGNKKLPELPSNEDLKLLVEIRKDLQKKERKLKDLLRSENCILRKFRRYKEDDSDQVLYFFSQVDMKLVSRVLNMSK
ncbi:hypothetical protein C2S53_007583, partial [Perilla frutescens var. hirtella]